MLNAQYSHERDEYYDAVSLDAARHIYQWKGKQPVHKPMSVPKPNFMVDTTVHVASQTERCKVLAKKVNANLSISQKIQQRILSNRVSMAQHVKPKKDTKDLKRHIRGFAPKTNLRKAIHARSPVITTLLPTAMEELQISIEYVYIFICSLFKLVLDKNQNVEPNCTERWPSKSPATVVERIDRIVFFWQSSFPPFI